MGKVGLRGLYSKFKIKCVIYYLIKGQSPKRLKNKLNSELKDIKIMKVINMKYIRLYQEALFMLYIIL